VAEKWLDRAEKELARCGYYEDDTIMVVQMNYTDMPKSWFIASGLENERQDDEERLSTAQYRHKWLGDYLDTVDNPIIQQEWVDAAIDIHKDPQYAELFRPNGARVVAHDPFDGGGDAGGYCLRHGSIIEQVKAKETGEIDEVCDWATGLAINNGADWFVWDGDGMGTGLKRQVSDAFAGKHIKYHMFKGSLSGSGQDNANSIYMPSDGDAETSTPKAYKDTFRNNRAQYYFELSRRLYNTYRFKEKGIYMSPDDMISLNSEGIDDIITLRSQLCRIPKKDNGQGLFQILNKKEMKILKIESPNEADSVMMSLYNPPNDLDDVHIDFEGW